jgi:hypothetical protein
MKCLIPASLTLLLAVLACSIPGQTSEPPITEPPILIEPPLLTTPMPIGFVVLPGTSSVDFYTPDGTWTGSVAVGDAGYYGTSSLHVAGSASSGTASLVYFSWRDEPVIIENMGGAESMLLIEPDFARLYGAEGSPWFAYTTATYTDSGLHTQLYVGTPATIASAAPVIDETVSDGQGLKPLALRMEGDVATGVWTTGYLVGIGGDLVFDPCNRVNFIDLDTGVRTELVEDGFMPSALSPDHTWVAYARPGGGEPLTILNLETGWNFTFPAWSLNDRGSGSGVFSPDNAYVAWMEGSGFRMDEPPTFRSMVRVGTTDGTLLGDFSMELLSATAGFTVVWAEPVGWVDNDSVLLMVADVDWTNYGVMRLDMPGTLYWLVSGNFAGLTYP